MAFIYWNRISTNSYSKIEINWTGSTLPTSSWNTHTHTFKHVRISQPMNGVYPSIHLNHISDPRCIPNVLEFIWWQRGTWYRIAYVCQIQRDNHLYTRTHAHSTTTWAIHWFLQSVCEWVELISFTCLFICLFHPFFLRFFLPFDQV